MSIRDRLFQCVVGAAAIAGVMFGGNSPSEAFIKQIVIDQTATVNFSPIPLGSSIPGPATSYTIYQGRIFGTLSSNPLNTVITDLNLAAPVSGGNSYIANFQIVTPTDATQRSGLLIYGVSNRGGNAINTNALIQGATYVQSGWQGDLLAECSLTTPAPYPCIDLNSGPYGTLNTTTGVFTPPTVPGKIAGTTNLTSYVIQVPVATTDGSPPNGTNTITGQVYSHVAPETSGSTAQLIISNAPSSGAPFTPYQPVSLDTNQATLWSETSQSLGGVDTNKSFIPSAGWSWAYCPSGSPGTPNTTWICLNNGATFDPTKLYEIVFTAANPLVLGVGYAATRDFVSFIHYGTTAPGGGANPVAGTVTTTLAIGSSQSGAFIRGLIFYGFNEDEDGRIVFDGAWPQIDGRMLWLNERWAQPTVLLQLYMGGDEAPVWWADFPNQARSLPADGILHRCSATGTCPQILETFGELEFYGEKMGPDLTGFCVTCTTDVPVPANVHRYFYPGTSHGGSINAGSFNWTAPPTTLPVTANQMYPSNPNGENYSNNALQADFIQFLMSGTPMPPTSGGAGGTYPTLASGQLVANTAAAVGFPTIPSFPYGGNNAWPPIVYDFGPDVNYDQETGVPTVQPPTVQQVLTPYVPHVNSDGNANVGGLPSIVFQVPLGTYVGWNIIPPPSPYAGQQDSLSGGFWPFWDTQAHRMSAGDARPSLEERYGTHYGYNCLLRQAANAAVEQRVLLASDATTAMANAAASNVLASPFTPTAADAGLANDVLCGLTDVHDFNGDGNSDILWRDGTGNIAIWLMNGSQVAGAAALGNVTTTWSIVGQRDFDGDGDADILWRDNSGDLAIWFMNGTQVASVASLTSVAINWTVYGTGDLNGDGKGDILWRDSTSGTVAAWLMNGGQVTAVVNYGSVPGDWSIVGETNKGQIFWRETAGNLAVWQVNGSQVTATTSLGNVPTNWIISGIGDFNGDGSADILWQDTNTGTLAIWFLNGSRVVSSATVAVAPTGWSIVQTGDYNGDGYSDIVWMDGNGNVATWFMNGAAVSSVAAYGSVGSGWSVQAQNAE